MRILVTGAAGFIGSHLAERLCEQGHEVIGLDSFDSYLYDAETKERNLATLLGQDRFTLLRADLNDGAAVAAACRGVELAVHLAALAGVRPSIADPVRYARTNLLGTTHLLEGLRQTGVKRLVFASSSSVYGSRTTAEVPFREVDPCLTPASPYAATKRAGELLCSTYRDLFGIGVTSLRFFTVYGPRQRPEMAIHKFTRAIARGEPVTLFGDGSTARDYTYIDDVIAGTLAACHKVAPGARNVYNLGGSRTTTLRELVGLISSALQRPAEIRFEPAQPGDVPITYADVSLASRELGYTPSVPIAEGIRRFVAWFEAGA